MNRQEKQELVSRLYKEGKTMREISKEVHMSFSDIGSIDGFLQELDRERKPRWSSRKNLGNLRNQQQS